MNIVSKNPEITSNTQLLNESITLRDNLMLDSADYELVILYLGELLSDQYVVNDIEKKLPKYSDDADPELVEIYLKDLRQYVELIKAGKNPRLTSLNKQMAPVISDCNTKRAKLENSVANLRKEQTEWEKTYRIINEAFVVPGQPELDPNYFMKGRALVQHNLLVSGDLNSHPISYFKLLFKRWNLVDETYKLGFDCALKEYNILDKSFINYIETQNKGPLNNNQKKALNTASYKYFNQYIEEYQKNMI